MTCCQLLKNYGVTNISLFISKGSPDFSRYHLVNEFFDIEEISPSVDKIFENFRKLIFRVNRHKIPKTNIFTHLKTFGPGIRKVSDIPLPLGLKVINSPELLFNVISNSVKIKIILEIEL